MEKEIDEQRWNEMQIRLADVYRRRALLGGVFLLWQIFIKSTKSNKATWDEIRLQREAIDSFSRRRIVKSSFSKWKKSRLIFKEEKEKLLRGEGFHQLKLCRKGLSRWIKWIQVKRKKRYRNNIADVHYSRKKALDALSIWRMWIARRSMSNAIRNRAFSFWSSRAHRRVLCRWKENSAALKSSEKKGKQVWIELKLFSVRIYLKRTYNAWSEWICHRIIRRVSIARANGHYQLNLAARVWKAWQKSVSIFLEEKLLNMRAKRHWQFQSKQRFFSTFLRKMRVGKYWKHKKSVADIMYKRSIVKKCLFALQKKNDSSSETSKSRGRSYTFSSKNVAEGRV